MSKPEVVLGEGTQFEVVTPGADSLQSVLLGYLRFDSRLREALPEDRAVLLRKFQAAAF